MSRGAAGVPGGERSGIRLGALAAAGAPAALGLLALTLSRLRLTVQEEIDRKVRTMHGTLTSKGQITVPKPIRDRLHLGPGDKLEFLVEEDGSVRVVPVTGALRQLRGMLKKPDRAVSLEEMEEAITREAAGT